MTGDYSSILGHFKNMREHINMADTIFLAFELYHELKHSDINERAQKNLLKLRRKEKKEEKEKEKKKGGHGKMLKGLMNKLF